MAFTRNQSVRPDINLLKPVARAYALGHLTSTGPRLLSWLRVLRRKDLSLKAKINILITILRTSIQLRRFPAACAIIVSGATVAPRLLLSLLEYATQLGRHPLSSFSTAFINRLRFVCTFLSACLAFELLNQGERWARKRALSRDSAKDVRPDSNTSISPDSFPSSPSEYAGKTVDFTSFALTRALDVGIVSAWTLTPSTRWHPEQWAPKISNWARHFGDPWIFATSSGIVMWSWFYSPERLPRTYNHWISKVAGIDQRVIEALRQARRGEYVYGQNYNKPGLLRALCRDLKFPEEWGDPAKTIPIPCELYHCGIGKSCEVHGLSRFCRGFILAFELYFPLQIMARLRTPTFSAFTAALRSATQSSSFLAAFVAGFYYAVCLARTRLGPRIFSYSTITPQMCDNGLCVLAGCLVCGWSIFLEKPDRRQEIASFVAPRALSTLMPRVYDKKYQRREQAIFATSVAVVLSAIKSEQRSSVRGVLGKVLERVLRE